MKRRYSVLLIVATILVGLPYSCGVWERAQDAKCIREIQPTYGRKPGVPPKYIGDICFVGRSNLDYLFRLYDAQTRELLVERHYRSTEIELIWGEDFVWYSDDEGVRLPPTWLDRLRAKLP
ncbi:hypothetical protein [Cupriavidus sp. DL-D2]|uniref:hypothetical protein n=1 Tax=Cupriavidus sp. DL-D2 TaxID=3144974 RepID=UPI0032154951